MISKKKYPTILVPQYNLSYPSYPLMNRIYRSKGDITVGSIVTWEVNSKRKGSHKPFTATGKVIKIYVTTFGSTISKEAAQIETSGEYLEVFPGRNHTTVSKDKLKVA